MKDISDVFCSLLELVGLSVDGSSERTQAQVIFAFCAVFGLVAGFWMVDLASTLWFMVAGLCGCAFFYVTYINRD